MFLRIVLLQNLRRGAEKKVRMHFALLPPEKTKGSEGGFDLRDCLTPSQKGHVGLLKIASALFLLLPIQEKRCGRPGRGWPRKKQFCDAIKGPQSPPGAPQSRFGDESMRGMKKRVSERDSPKTKKNGSFARKCDRG